MKQLEEVKKYDHRVLGTKQKQFFQPLNPGSCFFLYKEALICNKLKEVMWKQYRDREYKEVITPNMYNMQLWETSDHAEKYKEDMFKLEIGNQECGLKPTMNLWRPRPENR